MRKLTLLIVTVGVVGMTAALGASSATAADFYECSSCANVSGPNEKPIDSVTGENRSGNGLCATLWRFNGGESYTLLSNECVSEGFIAFAFSAGNNNAHGDTKRWFECCLYHLWGWQRHE